ncbi:hypothetical protein ASD08_13895 [Streptomyces sp. Root369]|nr:hypothetical protein ASD08_13895 [Streptomyces sp. Root369]
MFAVCLSGRCRGRGLPFLCRLITMAPALVVIAVGVSPDTALLLSQVVLFVGLAARTGVCLAR